MAKKRRKQTDSYKVHKTQQGNEFILQHYRYCIAYVNYLSPNDNHVCVKI